jgi:hypothetical protein
VFANAEAFHLADQRLLGQRVASAFGEVPENVAFSVLPVAAGGRVEVTHNPVFRKLFEVAEIRKNGERIRKKSEQSPGYRCFPGKPAANRRSANN